ncbi:MAG TPA: c-type cytochrome, partial [Ferruginibacter sp.]|nr:c-type cytochrome [Ferruginibacter sp.]
MKSVITIVLLIIFAGTFAQFFNVNKFKNLKVLPANISEKELDKLMDGYCRGLGVNCDYCHGKDKVTGNVDFVTDAKGEKEIARRMITMTGEINKKYFDFNGSSVVIQSVTCITCHHKNPIPIIDSM